MKNRYLIRVIAVGTLLTFCSTGAGWGEPAPSVEGPPIPAFDISKFHVPSEIANLQQVHSAGAKRTVIYVQDAHGVLDAQQNIQKLIQLFQDDYGIRVFGLEGSKEDLDPLILRAFPDAFIRDKVLRQYLDRGELTGADFAAITNPAKSVFHGLEDWNLYQENYLAYLQASELKAKILEKIEIVRADLAKERVRIYSPQFNRFHESVESFEDEKIGLLELLKFLGECESELRPEDRKITKTAAPHLFGLMNAVFSSKSGEGEINAEVGKVAEKFQNIFRFKPNLQKAQEFNTRYQGFRTGAEDAGTFLKFLVDAGKEIGYVPDLSFSMKQLLGEAETLSMIKGTLLFDELDQVIRDYRNYYAVTPEEKALSLKYERLRIVKTMASLELTRDQMDEFEKEPEAYLTLFDQEEEWMQPALRFYDAALRRDDAFLRKIDSMFEKEKTDVIVVLTGGFHSGGLERNLEKNGYNFAVLTPKMDSLNGQENYQKVMSGDLSYKEFLNKSFYDAFVSHSTLALARELSKPDFFQALKQWRDQVIRELANEGRLTQAGDYSVYIDRLVSVYKERYGDTEKISRTENEILRDIETVLANFNERLKIKIRDRFQSEFRDFRAGAEQFRQAGTLNSENLQTLSAQIDARKAGVNTILPLGNKEYDPVTAYISGKVNLTEAQERLTQTAKSELRSDAESRLSRLVGAVRKPQVPRSEAPLSVVSPELDPLPESTSTEAKSAALFNSLTTGSTITELVPAFKNIGITVRDPKDLRPGFAALYFELLDESGAPIRTDYRGLTVNAHVFIEGSLAEDSVHITAATLGAPKSRERVLISLELMRISTRYVSRLGRWKNLELTALNPQSRKFLSENLQALMKPGYTIQIPEDAENYKIPFENMNLDEPIAVARSEQRGLSLEDRQANAEAALRTIAIVATSSEGSGIGEVSRRASQYLGMLANAPNDAVRLKVLPGIEAWLREQRVQNQPRSIREALIFLGGSSDQRVTGLNRLIEWIRIDPVTRQVNAGVEQNLQGIETEVGGRLLDILLESVNNPDVFPAGDLIRVLAVLDTLPQFRNAFAQDSARLDDIAQQLADASFDGNENAQILAVAFSKLILFTDAFNKQRSIFETMLKVPAQDVLIKKTGSDVLTNLDARARSEVRQGTPVIEPSASPVSLSRLLEAPAVQNLLREGDVDGALQRVETAGNETVDGVTQTLEARTRRIVDALRQSGNSTAVIGNDSFPETLASEYGPVVESGDIDGLTAEIRLTPYLKFTASLQSETAVPVDSKKVADFRARLYAYAAATLNKDETLVMNISDKSDVEPAANALKNLAAPEVGVLGRLVIIYDSNVPLKQKLWSFIPNRSFVPVKTGSEVETVAETARREKGMAGENVPIVLTSLIDLEKLTDPAVRELLATLLSSLNSGDMKQLLVETAVVIAMRVKQLSAEERRNFREDPKAFAGFLRKEGFEDAIADSIGFGDKGFLSIQIGKFVTAFRSEIRAAQSA